MYWKILDESQELEVLLEAKATGWIAMGLSLDGTMPSGAEGADITMGWVSDAGIPQVYDYHSTARSIPDLDSQQNVTLLLGEEEDGLTKLLFRRPLDRGSDTQDRTWLTGNDLSRVIWAINSDTDPTSPTVWNKHDAKGAANFQLSQASECIDPSDLNVFTSPDGRYSLTWAITSNFAQFSMKAATNGWVAMGLSPSGTMSDADMMVGWVDDDDQVHLTDRSSSGYVQPEIDDSQDFLDVDGSETTFETVVSWRRPLNTGDPQDIPITAGEISLLWAYGTYDGTDDLDISAHSSRGVATVDLFSGASTGLSDPRLVHGLLMLLAWPVCAVGGAFVARYLKPTSDKWWKLHVWLQMGTIVLTIVSFLIVLSSFNWQFVVSPHSLAGGAVIAGSLLQGVLGAWAHKVYDATRTSPPVMPDKVHWWVGRLLIVLAYVTVFFGLSAWGASPFVTYALFAVVAYTALSALYLEMTGAAKGREHGAVETTSAVPSEKGAVKAGPGEPRVASGASSIRWSVAGVALIGFVGVAGYFAIFPPSLRVEADPQPWCPDCEVVDLLWPSYEIPLNSTSYACTTWSFEIPDGMKAIRMEAIVQPEDEPYFHHTVLGVQDLYDGGLINPDCPMPQGQMISAWAIGAGPLVFPDVAGLTVGVTGSSKFFTMQVHLDNAGETPDVYLNSGMRIYLTAEPREYDMGIAVLGGWANGTTIEPGVAWDPSQDQYGVNGGGWCGLNFTDGMHITHYIQHMHKQGRKQWVDIYNVNESNATYADASYQGRLGGTQFSFDDQAFEVVDPPMLVEAGNLFVTNCEWSTADKITPTAYGDGSDEEMCFFLIMFYSTTVDPLSPQINCGQQLSSDILVEYNGGCYPGPGVDYFDTLEPFCGHNSSYVPPERVIYSVP